MQPISIASRVLGPSAPTMTGTRPAIWSMLTAMTSVDNIIAGRSDKRNIWEVNPEQDYHETKEK